MAIANIGMALAPVTYKGGDTPRHS